MSANDFIAEKAKDRDRFELELSDTFDVKASIVLLILTFLGTLSATLLTVERLPAPVKLAQIPVIAGLVISGIFCVACLWPRTYLIDDLPETYKNSLPEMGNSEDERLEKLVVLSTELANARIVHNHALNETKAWALNGAFWSMTATLFVELGAVIYLGFAIRPS
jgi:hypothetical protein